MNHRLGSAALALALLAPLLAVGSVARAAVSPEDEAAEVIVVTQKDAHGDVRIERGERTDLPKRVARSIDVARVEYRIDRVAEQLTVTFTLRHRLQPEKRYRSYFTTVASPRPWTGDAPVLYLSSTPARSRVFVMALGTDPSASPRACRGATASVAEDRIVTQSVPFSCLEDVVEHGRFVSVVGLEHRDGGDIGYDLVSKTRDLPLTPYVAPPAD